MTPAQEDTLGALVDGKADPVPALELEMLGNTLRNELDNLLDGNEDLFLDAFQTSRVLGCQAIPETAFEWTAQMAVKPVVVEAIKLHVTCSRPLPPHALVEWALDSLSSQTKGVGEWLARAEPTDMADVVTAARAQLVQFMEMWPDMDHGWWPTAQVTSYAEWPGLKLKSKVDLAIGKTDNRALVNVVRGTGRDYDFEPLSHAALVETRRTGVAPRALVVARPEMGRVEVHPVDVHVLEAASRRLVGAVGELVHIRQGGQPKVRPGFACRRCPAADTCKPGQDWLREQDEKESA